MIENEVDREDKLSTVKDSALRLSDALYAVAGSIDDPKYTSAEDAARAVKMLIEAVRDADEVTTLIGILEQVTEYDELS